MNVLAIVVIVLGITLLYCASRRRRRRRDRIARCLLVAGTVLAFYGLLAFAGWLPL
jgi:hypothetical protein